MTTELLQPVKSGAKNIHFFEGRLLTGRDLQEQQAAEREHHQQLGRAIGPGIINGLDTTVENKGANGDPPVVRVSHGRAITSNGYLLEIKKEHLLVQLSREIKMPEIEGDLFSDCSGPPSSEKLPNGTGLFILCLSPTSVYEDFAPKSGLDSGGISSSCGRRYQVEGVHFRLVEFDPAAVPFVSAAVQAKLKNDLLSALNPADINQPARISMLRNILAHICFGTDSILGKSSDPFKQASAEPAGLDALFSEQVGILNACDVPLTMIYWTLDGIAFLDHWSVRRELRLSPDSPGLFENPSGYLYEAMFRQLSMQMEDLIKEMIKTPALAQRSISDFFYYLPPLGIAPIVGAGSQNGFNLSKFFAGRQSGSPTVVSKQDALDLYQAACQFHPILLQNNDVLQLYWVKENLDVIATGVSVQSYVIFSSRDLHGFRETDNVGKVLGQTWKSYSGLLYKQVLLPKTMATDAMPVYIALHTDQQNIIQYAMTRETAAGSRQLNRAAVMQTFDLLYNLQKHLVTSLEMTFENDEDLADRTQFADQLEKMLDIVLPSGSPALKTALAEDDFQSVLTAQQEINTYISTWSGEVISGRIQIQHVGSPDGEELVPGQEEPFVFEMLVTCRTEKRARILLSAHMETFTSGTWGDAIRIVDPDTKASIEAVELNPDQAKRVDVEVTVPNDAEVDEAVVMHVTAELPAPTNRKWIKAIPLQTAAEPGSAVKWRLDLQALSLAGGRDNATPAGLYEFIFTSEYLADSAPTSTQCTLTASFNFQNSVRSEWTISLAGQPNAETSAGSGIFTYSFILPAEGFGGRKRTRVRINAPTSRKTGDQTCSFTVGITSDIVDPETGSTISVSDTISEGLSVVLKGTAS